LPTIAALRGQYRSGQRTPASVVDEIFARIDAEGLAPIWISLADRDQAGRRAKEIDLSLPLAGVPFAVKDNIDVEGMATTAGCPSFAYRAQRSATVVARLVDAGAILIGKTNLDQFATGLVGMRSPYGACSSVFDERFVSGGSSSGSAVAVAKGLCAFSLGTDTAGSGRVPAAFNNLVGLKPTRGLLSTVGVVPACRSLDCVSIFATTACDAALVWQAAQGPDSGDPYSRTAPAGGGAAPWLAGPFRFGTPADAALEFFGDEQARRLFWRASECLEALGGIRVTIDFTPFLDAAALLYAGPWVAERFAAVGDFLAGEPADVDPIVGGIIRSSAKYSAADAYRAAYRLQALKVDAAREWAVMDVMLLPTTGTIFTKAAVESDPVGLNTKLGYYTNFVNLMDLAAMALPAGFRADGLPLGVSLIGPAFSDAALLALGERFLDEPAVDSLQMPGCISVAVVGAHLTGQPLNHQLTERGARLVRSCRTSTDYRLFALRDTKPRKPGLVRDPHFTGAGIEVEIWAVPEDRFGGFVAAVLPPLAIGNVRLDTGEWVKGFVCEPLAVPGAEEITHFGGWRQYHASLEV
jgi:allophanate hydrolase